MSDNTSTRLDAERWHRKPVLLCPAARSEPGPCDCGYVGVWVQRFWKSLQPCPPTWATLGTDDQPGEVVRRCDDCKAGGEGHLLFAGWEDKCPRCGDVERFTFDGELVDQRRNMAYTGSRDHQQDNVWDLLGMDDDREHHDG